MAHKDNLKKGEMGVNDYKMIIYNTISSFTPYIYYKIPLDHKSWPQWQTNADVTDGRLTDR